LYDLAVDHLHFPVQSFHQSIGKLSAHIWPEKDLKSNGCIMDSLRLEV
jgi:hypothetical protein